MPMQGRLFVALSTLMLGACGGGDPGITGGNANGSGGTFTKSLLGDHSSGGASVTGRPIFWRARRPAPPEFSAEKWCLRRTLH